MVVTVSSWDGYPRSFTVFLCPSIHDFDIIVILLGGKLILAGWRVFLVRRRKDGRHGDDAASSALLVAITGIPVDGGECGPLESIERIDFEETTEAIVGRGSVFPRVKHVW